MPDFIPVLGQLDDAVVVALVLRGLLVAPARGSCASTGPDRPRCWFPWSASRARLRPFAVDRYAGDDECHARDLRDDGTCASTTSPITVAVAGSSDTISA